MAKISYIRATSRQMNSGTNNVPTSMTLQPPIPSMITRPSFNTPTKISQQNIPKPTIMTPTTRFNTNPTVLIFDQQNGGRISKPLMEKRRRARINQCLSQLKTIVVDSAGQYTQNNKCKLEKADILELTVNYVKQLHQEHRQQKLQQADEQSQYFSGYSECVRQVCEYLTNVRDLRDDHKQSIKEYLQQCLALFHQRSSTFMTPPSPAPSLESSNISNSPDGNVHLSGRKSVNDRTFSQSFDHLHTRSDEDELTEDDDEDDDDDIYSDMIHNNENHPLNLKVNDHLTGAIDDDVWRPW